MKASMRDSKCTVSFFIPPSINLPKTDEFIRGGTAALVNILCTFPINKVMFRQQLTGNGMLSVGKALYDEGFRLLYRGVGAPIMQKTLSTSLMFGTYDFYRHGLLSAQRRFSDPNSSEALWIRLAASCLSGLTEALLTPFERVQTLLQIPRYNTRFTCFVDACHQLGLRESFTGFSAVALRNCIGSGLFLLLRDPLRALLPTSTSHWHNLYPVCSFVIAFVCLFVGRLREKNELMIDD